MPNYTYICKKCNIAAERHMSYSEYDREKNNQKCTCGNTMERVIELPTGFKLCDGMLGTGTGGWNK